MSEAEGNSTYSARVLVVDDSPVVCRLVSGRLSQHGYRVVTAPSGEAALERAKLSEFDVFVVDLSMPGMSGLELLPQLIHWCPFSPVIMLSATAEVDVVLDAMRQGAFDYVVKTAKFDGLVVAIQRSLEHRRILRENSLLTRRLRLMNEHLEEKVRRRTEVLEDLVRKLENERAELGAALDQLREAQSQLVQAQKLEGLGQLAAGIAHEINTPTQYVSDNVRFLRDVFNDLGELLARLRDCMSAARAAGDPLGDLEEAAESVGLDSLADEIDEACTQSLDGLGSISRIVSAMKEFSHPGAKERSPVDLNAAIETTVTVARNEWKHVADVELALDDKLPTVLGLAGSLNQVLLNLVVNAAHAIADTGVGEKGVIHISTCTEGSEAVVRVRDSGNGIPPEVQSRIFEPFFTTKEVGKGSGQGLAIARSAIVDKHGGHIEFETAIGHGTTFIVRLPAEGVR